MYVDNCILLTERAQYDLCFTVIACTWLCFACLLQGKFVYDRMEESYVHMKSGK